MKKTIVIATLCLITSLNAVLVAQDVVNRIKDNNSIVLGTSTAQEPFSYFDDEGTLVGIDIEIAEALAQGMNVNLVIKEVEFPLLLDELKGGSVDFVMSGLSMKTDRNMDFVFAGPYWRTDKAIVTFTNKIKKSDQSSLNSSDVKLAVLKNSTSEKAISQHYPNAVSIAVSNSEEAYGKLLALEADGFIADFESAMLLAEKYENLTISYIEDVNIYDPIGIAINPGDAQFHNILENFLKAVEDSGYLTYLKSKYYGE